MLVARGSHRLEGIAFYTGQVPVEGMIPLYRFSTPDGRHFLSTDRRPPRLRNLT